MFHHSQKSCRSHLITEQQDIVNKTPLSAENATFQTIFLVLSDVVESAKALIITLTQTVSTVIYIFRFISRSYTFLSKRLPT